MIFSNLNFDENQPIYLQIEKYIKDMIETGMVMEDSKLPATRELAKLLGVSRNSVVSAYENLEADEIIYTVKGKGTFIAEKKNVKKDKWIIDWSTKENDYCNLAEELDIVKSEIPWKKGFISFKSISPDGNLFDIDEFKKAFLNRISVEGSRILNYGYAQGYKPLINYLLEYMKSKGVDITDKDILITNGFTEGLEIILSSLTNPGDKIICENPTHNTSIKIMKVNKLQIVGVDMNSDGIDINQLEENLKCGEIKFGYITPSYHNPTGIVMNVEKRAKVYEIFKRYNVPIIEDGFNEELLYNSSHISPLAALDKESNGVIYIGSFSKVLLPGIRVGWVLGDKKLINKLESVKRCKNIHTSFLDQGILYEYLNSGAFEKYIKKIRKSYKERYEFATECINKYIKPDLLWGEGGLHLYVGIKGIDSRELLMKCYEKNVIFTPGDIFEIDNEKTSNFRLGLSHLNLEKIEEGIKIIAECIDELKST